MSDTGDIPQFVYVRADGVPKTRREMDEWIRKEIPKVHWLRIRACKDFHLPKQISWDMREVVLRHWLLDEMVRYQFITGDILGVNKTSSNDEAELRQFVQRLQAMVRMDQAVQPHPAEGIDMSTFPPAPPMPPSVPTPNGQTAAPSFAPPPPPMPPMPGAGPGMAPPPMPPGMGMAPPGYQAHPPAPPMMAPPPMGPQAGPPPTMPPAPPTTAAPAGPGRGRRKAAAAPAPEIKFIGADELVAQHAASQQQTTMAGPGFTPTFPQQTTAPVVAPPGPVMPSVTMPVAPQMPAVHMPQIGTVQATPAAPSISKEEFKALTDKVDKLTAIVEAIAKRVEVNNVATTALSRGVWNRPGSADIDEWLKELQLPNPSK